MRVLASDQFEGRAPGTEGERLTIDYIERAYAAAGLEPGVTLPNGQRSWVQETPLVAATLTTPPTLTLSGRDGARNYTYATQFTLPHNIIGISVVPGTLTVTVDWGADGTIDRTWTFTNTQVGSEAG